MSQFDGNAAFSGGGFMPSQANQGGESSLTPSKNRESQTLLPLTIKQINHALQSSDDRTGLTIDGVGVYTVTLVGRVCNKSGQITEFKFVLDDGTGTIECTKWLHEPADAMAVESIMNGMYVRLYGQLKGFHGKQTLSIFSLRPVTDFNEIASHFLECIYVHLYNSKLQHTQASIPNQQHAPNSIQSTATKGYQAQAIPPNQFSGQQNNGQKSVHDLVLEFLALPTNRAMEGGISCESIANNLGVSLDKVIPALDVLGSEGLVYEGLPMHYKICSDG